VRQRQEDQRREKREAVEEYKFRKEMDAHKERMLENMEQNKEKQRVLSQTQKERIWKREEEAFTKKHAQVQSKQ